jgi:hypothetical protein
MGETSIMHAGPQPCDQEANRTSLAPLLETQFLAALFRFHTIGFSVAPALRTLLCFVSSAIAMAVQAILHRVINDPPAWYLPFGIGAKWRSVDDNARQPGPRESTNRFRRHNHSNCIATCGATTKTAIVARIRAIAAIRCVASTSLLLLHLLLLVVASAGVYLLALARLHAKQVPVWATRVFIITIILSITPIMVEGSLGNPYTFRSKVVLNTSCSIFI